MFRLIHFDKVASLEKVHEHMHTYIVYMYILKTFNSHINKPEENELIKGQNIECSQLTM